MSEIRKDLSINNLEVNKNTYINGNIIPTTDSTFSIGSEEKKIGDMFISDDSLWIGDGHKLSISDGKVKVRTRKTTVVPPAVLSATGTEALAKAHAGVNSLAEMKLKHWKSYYRTLPGKSNAKIKDVFRDNADDYDDDNIISSGVGIKIYNNASEMVTDTSRTSGNMGYVSTTNKVYVKIETGWWYISDAGTIPL